MNYSITVKRARLRVGRLDGHRQAPWQARDGRTPAADVEARRASVPPARGGTATPGRPRADADAVRGEDDPSYGGGAHIPLMGVSIWD